LDAVGGGDDAFAIGAIDWVDEAHEAALVRLLRVAPETNADVLAAGHVTVAGADDEAGVGARVGVIAGFVVGDGEADSVRGAIAEGFRGGAGAAEGGAGLAGSQAGLAWDALVRAVR
jgi:hypothetical protein